MASRTSAGIGMTITVTIFIVLTMVFLFASVFLYSEKSNAEGRVRELTNTYEEVIKTGERQSSNVQVALGAARAERKSLVDYLLSNNAELNRVAFGNAALTIEQARDRADGLARGNASLAATITRLEGDVQSLTSERDSAIAQMRSNEADLNAEFERIRQIEASAMATAAEATDRVDEYAREVEALKARVEAFETRTSRTVDDDRQQYGADLRDRDQRIAELNQDILVLRDQVRRLRGETTDNRVTPLDEYALVDGEVAAVQPGDDVVVITLGREDKLVIGMTFSVFGSASAIRPTESGEYLPGKAVIEVIGMEESSARCRVIRASRGNPVVAGDVIANPVYDPDKTTTSWSSATSTPTATASRPRSSVTSSSRSSSAGAARSSTTSRATSTSSSWGAAPTTRCSPPRTRRAPSTTSTCVSRTAWTATSSSSTPPPRRRSPCSTRTASAR
jgi:hypothetical protein